MNVNAVSKNVNFGKLYATSHYGNKGKEVFGNFSKEDYLEMNKESDDAGLDVFVNSDKEFVIYDNTSPNGLKYMLPNLEPNSFIKICKLMYDENYTFWDAYNKVYGQED